MPGLNLFGRGFGLADDLSDGNIGEGLRTGGAVFFAIILICLNFVKDKIDLKYYFSKHWQNIAKQLSKEYLICTFGENKRQTNKGKTKDKKRKQDGTICGKLGRRNQAIIGCGCKKID